jgi:hypothetical protein
MALGTVALGVGGAAYVYFQTEKGRTIGDEAFKWVEDLFGLAPAATPKLSIKGSITVETKGINSDLVKDKKE